MGDDKFQLVLYMLERLNSQMNFNLSLLVLIIIWLIYLTYKTNKAGTKSVKDHDYVLEPVPINRTKSKNKKPKSTKSHNKSKTRKRSLKPHRLEVD